MRSLLLLIGLSLTTITAECWGHEKPAPTAHSKHCDYNSLVEAKVGYFFFTDKTMRKVYDQGGLDVQISGSTPVYKYLHFYGSVEFLEKSGHSLGGHQKTSIWEVPLSVGLKPVISITDCIKYYFTLGPRYIFAHAHNRSSFVSKKMNAHGFGGFVNTGFLFTFHNHLTLDLFGEYSYAKLHFHSSRPHSQGQTTQVGGLVFGAGLGYSF